MSSTPRGWKHALSRAPRVLGEALEGLLVTSARRSARTHGRRSALAQLGGLLLGGAVTTLPFDRAFGAPAPEDDETCTYWRYCALDGFLCTTAGGSKSTCPMGSEASQVSWVGTCHNPADKRDYLVSYYDCCGNTPFTGAKFCLGSKGERPPYTMGLNNDVNWCMANANKGYHCTVAIVVGTAG
ncbi:MAG: amine dehydrogenase [Phenylobacterium sp. RIFCSPHIGHO2_01_FULL_69_31]|uniref:methylamine dehydrogenase light chain n=1 Tax=unclassified Phenylobacterium TaxID=2640670 RepID=UPI0008B93A90|nr:MULTISPECIES: methylamine dehydrogenase light chain [unclassified Phenylobacterium]OHB26869.1 MAG: amine dehydrogenase [Phenylobacterium sp. RIFCSPHIGHO2_01_FULL_69_31]TAJ69372.1 MAG: amine dehydrogenase [Phenylobacterium sp.]